MNKTYSSKSNARRAFIKAGQNPDNMIHKIIDGKHTFEAKAVVKANGSPANTKARQARAIIAEEYNVAENNSAEVITRLQNEFEFSKRLATVYFNNNLAKLQE